METRTKPRRRQAGSGQPIEVANIPDALLTLGTACKIAGVSEPTLRRWEKEDPDFPGFVKIGARCTRVRAGAFTAYLNTKGGQQ